MTRREVLSSCCPKDKAASLFSSSLFFTENRLTSFCALHDDCNSCRLRFKPAEKGARTDSSRELNSFGLKTVTAPNMSSSDLWLPVQQRPLTLCSSRQSIRCGCFSRQFVPNHSNIDFVAEQTCVCVWGRGGHECTHLAALVRCQCPMLRRTCPRTCKRRSGSFLFNEKESG